MTSLKNKFYSKISLAFFTSYFICTHSTPAQEWQWAKTVQPMTTEYTEVTPNAMVNDSEGNIYVAGQLSGPVDFDGFIIGTSLNGSKGFLAKYDKCGKVLWAKMVADFTNPSSVTKLTIDKEDNLILAGYFQAHPPSSTSLNTNIAYFDNIMLEAYPNGNSVNLFLAKYNSSGEAIWAKKYDGGVSSFYTSFYGIGLEVGSNNDIYVASRKDVLSTFDITSCNLYKYTENGDFLWKRPAVSRGDLDRYMTIDKDDNIYITGAGNNNWTRFGTPQYNIAFNCAFEKDVYLVKYDSSATIQWVKNLGGERLDQGRVMTTDENGDIYLSIISNSDEIVVGDSIYNNGGFQSSMNNILLKYSSNGELIWSRQFSKFVEYIKTIKTIGTDIYVGGLGGIIVGEPFNPVQGNAFIAKLNHLGGIELIERSGNIGSEVRGISIVGTEIFVTGKNYYENAIFGNHTINSINKFFTAKFGFLGGTSVDKPQKVVGDTLICNKSSTLSYSVALLPNVDTYIWTLPDGFIPLNNNYQTNTNAIQVFISENAVSGIIKVRGKNDCGEGQESDALEITILDKPDKILNIIGDTHICFNQNNAVYTVPPTPNALQYIWTLPDGASVSSGSDTTNVPQINLNFAANFTGGVLKVKGMNECGIGEEASLQIQTTPALQNPTAIQGNTQLCQGTQNELFRIEPIENATEYIWVLPNGVSAATGSSVTNVPQIHLNFAPSVTQGEIRVSAKNNCPNSETENSPTLNFTIINPPARPGTIQGKQYLCVNTNQEIYEITPIEGVSEYIWEVPAGVEIITGQNTHQIEVNFTNTAVSGYFRVRAKNQCFIGEPSALFEVRVTNALPTKPEIALDCDILIANQNENYLWFRNNQPLLDSTKQTLSLNQAGEYFVRVSNICGYIDSDRITFTENTCETTFHVPSAFSPNGDNLNDNLEIFGRNFTKLEFRIYNRWGELIYIAYRQADPWNGMFNGKPVPDGVYVWVATYESTVNSYAGQKFKKSGRVTVMR